MSANIEDAKPILLTESELRVILSGAGRLPLRDDEFRDLIENGMPGPVAVGMYDADACCVWCLNYWMRQDGTHQQLREALSR